QLVHPGGGRRHPVLVVLHLGGDPDAHWFSFTIIGRPVADGSVWHAHAAARRSTLAAIPYGGIRSERRDTPMRYMVWRWTGAGAPVRSRRNEGIEMVELSTEPTAEDQQRIDLAVGGMTCASCAARVEK